MARKSPSNSTTSRRTFPNAASCVAYAHGACGWLLHQIALLYFIKAHLRTSHAGPKLRATVRASQSAPILRRIRAELERIRSPYLPQSAFGKAITCTLHLWPALEHFVTDGRIEFDNNGVERRSASPP